MHRTIHGAKGRSIGQRLARGAGVLVLPGFLMSANHSQAFNAPAVAWTNHLGSGSDSSPAIAGDGTIYIGTFKGDLMAVDTNGTAKWTFTTGHGKTMGVEIQSSPAVGADGTVYFGCRDRKCYALGADGKKKWEYQTGGWVDSSPALGSDGTVYFGSWDKKFYALKADGSVKWEFQTGGVIDSSPAIGAEGVVYFGSHDKKFYALQPDGRKKWEFATGGQIISSPALDAREGVYFTSVDGWCYGLDRDGGVRWRLHTGGCTGSSPVIAADGRIYVGVNQELWAISPDGQKIWARPDDLPIEASPTAFADGSVCFISRLGYMIAMAPDREMQWAFFFGAYGCNSPAIGLDGTLYAPMLGGDLVALRTTAPLPRASWPKFRGNARNTGNVRD